MYKVKTDNPDVGFKFSKKVTDSEGNPINDPAQLATITSEITSDNPDAVAVFLSGGSPEEGTIHFGNPGIAALSISVKKNDGTILGSGVFGFTVVTGDPNAVTDIKLEVEGLTEEPVEEPPVEEPPPINEEPPLEISAAEARRRRNR